METRQPTHKLVCILHADVAGYSRLTSEHEDQSFELLQTAIALFSAILSQHGGQVVNRAGDAMLVKFDSAYNAVTGALAAQAALASANAKQPEDRRIELRVGINIGDVVESASDIFGHGVNVAARIQTLAEPGGICVSEPVRLAFPRGSGIAFAPIGERSLKNIQEPVQVYKVTAASAGTIGAASSNQASNITEHKSPTHVLRRILVLPFTVFSSNPDHAYLADGFCEDLITELSRFRSFAVLARTTAFAFKGTTRWKEASGRRGEDCA
jgi:adenylate cyclase